MAGATAVGGLKITISPRSLLSFPGGSAVKNSPAIAGNTGSIPGWGRSPGEENGKPLQYSCLENPTDRGAWQAMVHGVAESDTTMQLSTYTQDPFHLRHSTILSKFSREDCTVAADFSLFFFYDIWDLSSWTRDGTCAPCSGSLDHWTAREVPVDFSFKPGIIQN